MMRFLPYIGAAVVLLLPLTAVSAQSGEQVVELKNGQGLTATVVETTEEGLALDVAGNRMQVEWSLLRAERFLEQRRALVKGGEMESLRAFALWCRDAALDDELKTANERLTALGGVAVEALGAAVGPTSEPGVKVPPDKIDTPDPKPKPKPQPGPELTLPASVSLELGKDADFAKKTRAKLEAARVTIKTSGAEARVAVSGYELKEVEVAEFVGAVVFAVYKGVCKVELKDAKGKLIDSCELDTGDKRSTDTREAAKTMCREELARCVANWVSAKVQTGGAK